MIPNLSNDIGWSTSRSRVRLTKGRGLSGRARESSSAKIATDSAGGLGILSEGGWRGSMLLPKVDGVGSAATQGRGRRITDSRRREEHGDPDAER